MECRLPAARYVVDLSSALEDLLRSDLEVRFQASTFPDGISGGVLQMQAFPDQVWIIASADERVPVSCACHGAQMTDDLLPGMRAISEQCLCVNLDTCMRHEYLMDVKAVDACILVSSVT